MRDRAAGQIPLSRKYLYSIGMGMRVLSLAAVALAGCYQSYPWTLEDAGVDPGVDPGDAGVEWDVEVDPDADPWEVDPDIPGEAGEVCEPPATYIISVAFYLDDLGHDEVHDITLDCGPPVISGSSEEVLLGLDCADGFHEFLLSLRPGIDAARAEISERVTLRYVSRGLGAGWSFKWFTLRSASGDLIMAGVQSNDIVPPDRIPEEWYAPIWVGVEEGLCPIENPGCYTTERLAIDVVCGGIRERFFEDSRGRMGDTGECYVQVGEAFRTVRVSCAGLEMPGRYYAFVVVR
jgi:hypothetical protein